MVATPLFGVPDEPAHIVRAVSVAKGQILGSEPSGGEFAAASPYVRGIIRTVEVPAILDLDESTTYEPPCYAFEPTRHAGCLMYGSDTGSVASVPTTAGTHPPGWYAFIGIPGLLSVDAPGIFAMRFVNVLMTAAFVACAAFAVSKSQSPFGGIGLAFAVTPMVFFLGGGVNSSGPEAAAAIALWAGLAVLLQTIRTPRHVLWMTGVAALAVVTIRRTGVVWFGLIVVLALLAFGSRRRVSNLIRQRAVWAWGAAIGVALALQLAWLYAVDSLSRAGGGEASPGIASTITRTLGNTYDTIVVQMIGNFGWLDTPVPTLVVILWTLGIGGLVAVAVLDRRVRAILTAGATVIAILATFVAFELVEAGSRPGFWQGRYSLPLAVGVPIVLGLSIGRSSRSAAVLGSRRPLAALFVGAHVIAFFVYLERYGVGSGGGFRLFWSADWSAPIPALVLMVGYIGAVGVFATMAAHSFRSSVSGEAGAARAVDAPRGG